MIYTLHTSFTCSLKGLPVSRCQLLSSGLKKLKRFSHQLNFKIMSQLCYLRLYLGIEIVSCSLLQRVARMRMDSNLKTLGQPFQV